MCASVGELGMVAENTDEVAPDHVTTRPASLPALRNIKVYHFGTYRQRRQHRCSAHR